MVKFTASGDDGRTLIGLGLEEGNLARLRAGQPLIVKLRDLGFTGAMGATEILIFYGRDDAALRDLMAPRIGPQTVVHEEHQS